MTASVEFRVQGLAHLEAMLTDAPPLIKVEQVKAMEVATLLVEAEAKARVRRRTGRLQSSIHHGVEAGPGEVRGRVGTAVSYGPDVEYGTAPHDIAPVTAQALMIPLGGGGPSPFGGGRLSGSARSGQDVAFFRKVHHPGTKPYPFLVPALEQSRGRIARLFQAAIQRAIATAGRL